MTNLAEIMSIEKENESDSESDISSSQATVRLSSMQLPVFTQSDTNVLRRLPTLKGSQNFKLCH
jgi:hypothetical protein